MPLPLVATSFGGLIVTSLTVFFATRIPVILSTLGLSIVVYTCVNLFMNNMIGTLNGLTSGGVITGMGFAIDAGAMLGAAGVWDALNIVLSGYVCVAGVKATKLSIQSIK